MTTKRAYTVMEAAGEIGCGRTKIFELIHSKKIKALRLDGKLLILGSDIDAFLQSLPEAA